MLKRLNLRLDPDERVALLGRNGNGKTTLARLLAAQLAPMEGAMNEAIYEVVLRLGGSISAEHGIGQLKTALLEQVKDPVALDMMRAIKRALDPNNILNPGKVLG